MKEYVYYIPILDEIVVWKHFGLSDLKLMLDDSINLKKHICNIIYLGEL